MIFEKPKTFMLTDIIIYFWISVNFNEIHQILKGDKAQNYSFSLRNVQNIEWFQMTKKSTFWKKVARDFWPSKTYFFFGKSGHFWKFLQKWPFLTFFMFFWAAFCKLDFCKMLVIMHVSKNAVLFSPFFWVFKICLVGSILRTFVYPYRIP